MNALAAMVMLLSMTAMAQVNPTTPRVTFLSLHVADVSGKTSVELINSKRAEGLFKIGPVERVDSIPGTLVLRVRSSMTGSVEFESPFVNPLKEDLEYSPREGTLARTMVKRSAGDVTVRLPFALEGKSVEVQQVQGDGARLTLKVLRF